jgi:hypothetical protein
MALAPHASVAQYAVGATSTQTRIDFAKVDRARILTAAATALGRTVTPTSDAESDSFLQMTLDLPALAAAVQIDPTREAEYHAKAHQTLLAWFGTRNSLKIEISGFEGLLPLCQLAEVAVGIPFLALPDTLASAIHRWFKGYLSYLTTDETAGLARDARDRHGCSWLLQVAAYAKLLDDDETLQAARVRYRHATLRAELNADGFFAQDLRSADPFRYSLMDLDMLAGVCTLLSTRFESLWDAELQDGPGMRGAIARHAPYIAKPIIWPYPSDAEHFMDLPGRRPALAFAARAYAQPEYASLFLTLHETKVPDLLRTTPIRQPLLWLTTPRRSATQ